jgi:hypothetical protein
LPEARTFIAAPGPKKTAPLWRRFFVGYSSMSAQIFFAHENA